MTTTPPAIDDVCELIAGTAMDVLATVFDLGAVPAEPVAVAPDTTWVASAVGFAGDTNGVIYLRASAPFARTLAMRMLGLGEAEIEGDEMVNDVMGELGNMIVGGVKSRLCDSGHPCVLTIPTIVRGVRLQAAAAGGGERRELNFRCGEDTLVVEVLMKSAA